MKREFVMNKICKKIFSFVLIIVMLYSSIHSNAQSNVSSDFRVNWILDNRISMNIDRENYIYDIVKNNLNTKITLMDSNLNIINTYTYNKKDNVLTLSDGKKVHNAIKEQSSVSLYSSGDYIFREVDLNIGALCSAVGIGISVAEFVGILMSYSITVTVTIGLKQVIKAAVGVSISYAGSYINKTINIKFKCYKERVCRGSECFTGYYDCRYYKHSIY